MAFHSLSYRVMHFPEPIIMTCCRCRSRTIVLKGFLMGLNCTTESIKFFTRSGKNNSLPLFRPFRSYSFWSTTMKDGARHSTKALCRLCLQEQKSAISRSSVIASVTIMLEAMWFCVHYLLERMQHVGITVSWKYVAWHFWMISSGFWGSWRFIYSTSVFWDAWIVSANFRTLTVRPLMHYDKGLRAGLYSRSSIISAD